MKTNQNHSHGLLNISSPNLISKSYSPIASISKQTELLSKHFSRQHKSKKESDYNMLSQSSKCLDSPYRNSLSEIKCLSSTNDPKNDFKTPKPMRTAIKVFQKTAINKKMSNKANTKKSKTRKSSKGNYLIKFTKDNFGQTDVNPNHLQMALALSKSTYSIENPGHRYEEIEDIPNFLAPEKIAKVKTTLERYGFKSNKPQLNPDFKKDRVQVKKQTKISKYQFITPILKTRTEEERKSIITSKVALILQENKYFQESGLQHVKCENKLFSDFLKTFAHKQNIILTVNGLTQTEICNFSYYNKQLQITRTNYKCGNLLRNWDDIPGREKSPDRSSHQMSTENIIECDNIATEICKNIKKNCIGKGNLPQQETIKDKEITDNNSSNQDMPSRDSISPDLFGSDDEFTVNDSPRTWILPKSNSLSQFLINVSPSKIDLPTPPLSGNVILSHDCERKLPKCDSVRNNANTKHLHNHLNESQVQTSSPLKDDKYMIYDLTQSSESEDFEDTNYTEDTKLNDLEINYRDTLKGIRGETFSTHAIDNNSAYIANNKSDKHELTQHSLLNNININCDEKIDRIPLEYNEQTHNLDNNIEETEESDDYVAECDLTQDLSSDVDVKNYANRKLEYKYIYNESDNEINNKNVNAKMINNDKYLMKNLPSNDINADFNSTVDDMQLDNKNQEDYIDNNEVTSVTKGEISRKSNIFRLKNSFFSTPNKNLRDTSIFKINAEQHFLNEQDDNSNVMKQEMNSMDMSNMLNVTDYVNDILKTDSSINQEHIDIDLCKDPLNKSNLSLSSCSQESIIISDEELNYSCLQYKDAEYNRDLKHKGHIYELTDTDDDRNEVEKKDNAEIDNLHSVLKTKYGQSDSSIVHNRITELKDRVSISRESLAREFLDESFTSSSANTFKYLNEQSQSISQCNNYNNIHNSNKTQENATTNVTPEKWTTLGNTITPENSLIIKTKNVTPIINYDELDTPKINRELQKFGLKPLKRQRGAKLLKYLYDCTHPLVGPNEINELSSDENDERIVKKRKQSDYKTDCNKPTHVISIKDDYQIIKQNNNIVGGEDLLKNEKNNDLIFERKYSTKILTCRVPLQIVWYNFVCNNPEIEENILMYEPLQLEVLHSMLKEQSGCKFHVQDLLMFLDKRCITIRTGQGQEGKKTN